MEPRIEKARKWGGSVVVPLTGFLKEGRRYIIQEQIIEVDGEQRQAIVLLEDKIEIPKVNIAINNNRIRQV